MSGEGDAGRGVEHVPMHDSMLAPMHASVHVPIHGIKGIQSRMKGEMHGARVRMVVWLWECEAQRLQVLASDTNSAMLTIPADIFTIPTVHI